MNISQSIFQSPIIQQSNNINMNDDLFEVQGGQDETFKNNYQISDDNHQNAPNNISDDQNHIENQDKEMETIENTFRLQ